MKNIVKILALLLVVSCSSESDDKTSATSYNIEGQWKLECIEFSSDGQTERISRWFEFEDSRFTEQVIVFDEADEDCSTALEERQIEGSFSLGVTPASGPRSIDFEYTSVEVTANASSLVDYYNTANPSGLKVCGGDWVKDRQKSLTKTLCSQRSDGLPYAPMSQYDVYAVQDNKLQLGLRLEQYSDSTSERPSNVDTATEIPKSEDEDPIIAALR